MYTYIRTLHVDTKAETPCGWMERIVTRGGVRSLGPLVVTIVQRESASLACVPTLSKLLVVCACARVRVAGKSK